MTQFTVVNRAAMAPGASEDISVVLANLDAIATILNGGLGTDNFPAGAVDLSRLAASGAGRGDGLGYDGSGFKGVPGPGLNVRLFGAKGDGATNDTAALQAAITAATITGEPLIVPRGTYPFTDELLIPNGVNIRGVGSGGTSPAIAATKFKCLNAAAHLQFGALGAGSYGGLSGGFRVDANGVATSPFRVGRSVGRLFQDIQINGAAVGGSGALIQEAQNCLFQGMRVESCAGDGWTLDAGTGGHTFVVCTSFNAGRYGLVFTQSYATPVATTGLYAIPSSNLFLGCIWEGSPVGSLGAVKHEAGYENHMIRCNLVATLGNILDMGLLAGALGSTYLTLDDCVLFGDPAVTTAVKGGTIGGRLVLRGHCRIHGHLFAYNLPGNHVIIEDVETEYAAIGTMATGAFASAFENLRSPARAGAAPIHAGMFSLLERTGPPVPPADGVYIFARDNGAGKTQVCLQYATGAVHVLDTQT
jgi:hypothetical protein